MVSAIQHGDLRALESRIKDLAQWGGQRLEQMAVVRRSAIFREVMNVQQQPLTRCGQSRDGTGPGGILAERVIVNVPYVGIAPAINPTHGRLGAVDEGLHRGLGIGVGVG